MTIKSTSNRAVLIACAAILLAALAAGPGKAAETCFQTLAATRNFTLGQAQHAVPLPDGHAVLYLRSGPRDTRLGLYAYDLTTHAERTLAEPARAPEHLSVEEKARRERARMTLTGITHFDLSQDGHTILVAQAGNLATIAWPSGATRPVPGEGWIAPRLSPDGTTLAAVRDNDLHVIDLATGHDTRLTTGGSDTLTHGLAEFAAAEELDRSEGTWWSPDNSQLVYEEADTSGVEKHFIADPEHPSVQPVEFRYPRAGTANAKLRLGIISRNGGKTVWIDWNHDIYPYVARVVWPKSGKLSLVLLTRLQTQEVLVSVDPATGATKTLLTEDDPAWLNLDPQHGLGLAAAKTLPLWLSDGSGFLWAAERGGVWRLELHGADGKLDHAVTPPGLPFDGLDDLDEAAGSVVVTASPDRLGTGLFRVGLHSGVVSPLAAAPGLHDGDFGEDQHAIFADRFSGADGGMGTAIRDASGKLLAMLPNKAETMPPPPGVQFLRVGPLQMDAAVIRPAGFSASAHYPVVLSVYAGPTVKVVVRAPRRYAEDQCLADQGFIVVSVDGRGTPGRGRDWERATKNDLIDLPLEDQIAGVQALGKIVPQMDLSRVGVEGWSFGGYFTAMATIRRPDVFKAGVAGAPVVDFADYDTAYTERYLGLPETDAEGYRKSNVLTYAASLQRPLLIMHGLTDDNVYFENTVKLTQALITAGKPYDLLLLPGTHLLPDPLLRSRVDEARAAFLKAKLGK
jgi:dipeptidyl-peptidase-4